MNKKTFGLGLIVVGGLLAAAALANMPTVSAHLPVSVTSKIPVVPTGTNKYNLGIGLAVAAVGFYLKY
jgi:hypothetical protein